MEKHVPKLATCQRLKELGFPQQSCQHYWYYYDEQKECDSYYGKPYLKEWIILSEYEDEETHIAAPLATELLEWLPKGLSYIDGKYILKSAYHNNHINIEYSQLDNKWLVNYISLEKGNLHTSKENYEGVISRMFDVKMYNTVSEALAQMLIYLVENKLVSFEKEQK